MIRRLFLLTGLYANLGFADVRAISLKDAQRMVKSEKAVFVDAKEPFELSKEYKGALNLPYLTLQRYPAKMKELLAKLPKNKALIVFCANGSRSKPSADILAAHGYKTFILQ